MIHSLLHLPQNMNIFSILGMELCHCPGFTLWQWLFLMGWMYCNTFWGFIWTERGSNLFNVECSSSKPVIIFNKKPYHHVKAAMSVRCTLLAGACLDFLDLGGPSGGRTHTWMGIFGTVSEFRDVLLFRWSNLDRFCCLMKWVICSTVL